MDHIRWKPSKRRFLDDHIDEVIRLTLEEITIYQGVGNPGGEVEGEDIVKEINFDPEWINLIKLRLYETFDVLSDMDVRQGIKEFSNWPTIPQVYLKGEFLGGSDILIEMYNSGELKEKIEIELAS